MDKFLKKNTDEGITLEKAVQLEKQYQKIMQDSPTTPKKKAASSVEIIHDQPNYHIGDIITHKVFGNGEIIDVIPNSPNPFSNDTLLEIRFDKGGVKKIKNDSENLMKI